MQNFPVIPANTDNTTYRILVLQALQSYLTQMNSPYKIRIPADLDNYTYHQIVLQALAQIYVFLPNLSTWGNIKGTITNQTDLVSYVATQIANQVVWGGIHGTLTNQTDLTAYISGAISAALTTVLQNQGSLDCSSNPNYPAAAANYFWIVSSAGLIGGASGLAVAVNDWVVCKTASAGGSQAAVGNSYYVIQSDLTPSMILGTILTGLNTTAGTVTATDSILSAIGKLVGNIQAAVGTGYITLTLATALTGFSASNSVVTAADGVLVAFGKLQGQISAILSAGYQTASQVTTAITSYGYQTAAQVTTAITSYGYQTAAQVTTAITSYAYATLASPTFTGTPAAPTAAAGTNTTQLATTAFAQALANTQGYSGVNAQTGTTYTLVLTDANRLVTLNNASAIALTVPTNASVAFSVGQIVDFAQIGAGRVTVAGAGGVTVNSNTGLITTGQYAGASLVYQGSNVWLLVGNTATS